MGWFWANPKPRSEASPSRSAQYSTLDANGAPPPGCPMHKKSGPVPLLALPSEYPVDHDSLTSNSKLNPFNLMSSLPQTAVPGQSVALPTERTVSSIPKGTSEGDGHWEYPSPQQMYHAMVRKGYKESSPEEIEAIENMVAIHNFLNEGAWQEILAWEQTFSNGILAHLKSLPNSMSPPNSEYGSNFSLQYQPRLLRFQGRSQDLTPKARILQLLGTVYPSRLLCDPPFDRHDWYVIRTRPNPDPSQPPIVKEVRYVIDYYSGPPEPTGEPAFYLDVRPALDSPEAVMERAAKWSKEVWDKASGREVKETEKAKTDTK